MSVIDGSNLIVGRAASVIAQRLIKGERIDIINAEKMVFTGTKENLLEKYKTRRELSEKGNPHKGPKYSRMPDRIVKRAVRGMVPWKKAQGKIAFKNFRAHIGIPEEFEKAKTEKIESAINKKQKGFLTVEQLSKNLGATW
ncbi:MAG: 50S ribosomal protein L13 [archaeon]|nr:50S ribosomal protein L13 [archaeon]